MPEYCLPDVGEGLTEAEIVEWKVGVGDVIEVNDVVCDIETAKSIVELPSPFAGTVLALLAQVGETVEVGSPILSIGEPDQSTEQQPAGIDLSNPAATGGGDGESLVGRAKAERGATRRRRRTPGSERAGRITAHADVQDSLNAGMPAQHEAAQQLIGQLLAEPDEPTAAPATSAEAATRADTAGRADADVPARVRAKPLARKVAKAHGIDISTVTPTGPRGTVTRNDVLAAAGLAPGAGAGAPAAAATAPSGADRAAEPRETREPIKSVRKVMAQAMVSSAFTAPHVTEWVTVDVTSTMEFVGRLRERSTIEAKVTPLLLVARAVLLALRSSPEINSTWDEQAQEIVHKRYVNLGIAAATPRGLLVPNIKDADRMDLGELAAAMAELTATARDGRTPPGDMADGTFTITNVGVFGIDAGTPIINPGESAILAFGAVRKQPWVVTGADGVDEIAIRQVTTLALSFDHRHIDGATGSRFLADVAQILEDPATALLY